MRWEHSVKSVVFAAIALASCLIGGLGEGSANAQSVVGKAADPAGLQLGYPTTIVMALLTCLALAWQNKALRKQRDVALEKVEALEALSERDPLTGLLNRRVVEERFASLRQDGFDTFALIDLDKFKLINDRFGHLVGDDVLVICGDILRGGDDRNCIAVRLGGEEFAVLLRGDNPYERAEGLRQSITLRVANEVEGLDAPLTASMGLIELPPASHRVLSFEKLYSRADQLLYNAKASGRNRTCFERLTVFSDAPAMRYKGNMAA